MRMGKASRRLRGPSITLGSTITPRYAASPQLVVGQIQSNVVASVYFPALVALAEEQLERHAALMVEYDGEVARLVKGRRREREVQRLESGDGGDDRYDLDDVDIADDDGETEEEDDAAKAKAAKAKQERGGLYADLPPPPAAAASLLYTSAAQLADLTDFILAPHLEHFTQSATSSTTSSTSSTAGAEWKIHANAAKFSRLLDERYGPFRPLIVDRYPQIERSIRNVQRKYARGELSPLRRGDPPLPPSTAIIVLFMMQRNGIRWEVLGLAATFLLVGLQPWALVVLVSGGHRWRMHRKFRRVAGMAKGTIAPTEPYYSATAGGGGDGDGKAVVVGGKDLTDAEERKRRYDLLTAPVGVPLDSPRGRTVAADVVASSQDEAKYDALVLGAGGVDGLYAAALLARAGRRVAVLCTSEDAAGCVATTDAANGRDGKSGSSSIGNPRWDGVPFDVASSDLSEISRQQALLAPALATTTDAQGGIRFARVGSAADGYAHTVLSIPGVGADHRSDAAPFVLHAGGVASVAEEAAAVLGDGYPPSADGGGAGDSASLQYLNFCNVINDTAARYYQSKLLPDEVNSLRNAGAYQAAGIRYAAGYLNRLVPLNGHVRSLLAGMGCRDENLRPAQQSMAAHVSNVGALCSPEGMCYPVGGPRALSKALESVVVQNGGAVLTGVSMKEFIFEEEEVEAEEAAPKGGAEKSSAKKTGDDDKKKKKKKKKVPAPQCIGVTLGDGREIHVREEGAVVSMLGFIPTFAHLLNPDVRTKHGVPRGLPALSERRPLLKILIGLNGTADDLSITGADWYRLPNASRAFDESDPTTGEVKLGEIGMGPGSGEADADGAGEDGVVSAVETTETGEGADNAARRGKHSKKTSGRRNKFDTGVSWIKVSFPSAKDPSWEDRHGDISTCVVTIEADDDFVTRFDSKPAIFSNHKVGADVAQRLMQRVLKDVLQTYPQLEGKVAFSKLLGPVRAGLSHNPERYAAKGIRPQTLYPGLYVGGSDLTVGDSLSGSIVGGWLAANAVMDYNFIDYIFLEKHIVSDLALFMKNGRWSGGEDDIAVPFTLKPEVKKIAEQQEKPGEEDSAAAESSKEE